MTRTEVLTSLDELLETETPLTGSEELATLGSWDSIAVIGLIALADDKYHVSLAAKTLNACKTVDDLVDLFLHQTAPC
jgi:acyl carrier protein